MKTIRFATFDTLWGCFGLAADGDAVCRTYLPQPDAGRLARLIADEMGDAARQESGLMRHLQERIEAYFEGENVDFSTDPAVSLSGHGAFDQTVLATCRQIGPGHTVTYGQLAEEAGSPGAARAVGSVMARNPIPLIIPCHRVLRSDGSLGGFSAPGGIAVKQRMLELERAACGIDADLFAMCALQ